MHYAQFADWIHARVDELVAFGVPREDAEAMMRQVESGGIAAEAQARSDRQFLLDFDRVGSEELGLRYGVSGQAIRKRRTAILQKTQPEVARMVAG